MGQKERITEKRVRKELTEDDRYKIERWLKEKYSVPEISKHLGFHPKTIRREIIKGTVSQRDTYLRDYECYKADYAQRIHNVSVSRRGRKPVELSATVITHIKEKLRNKYSPDAIIGEANRDGLFDGLMCTKTLYNWLQNGYIAGFKMSKRKRPVHKRKVAWKNSTARRINERPQEADDRQPGHWEMDTVVSGKTGSGCLLVLTERSSRRELMYLLNSRSQQCVIKIFDMLERRHKTKFSVMFKTITCDNGSEFLDSASLERSCLHEGKRTDIYYAHPFSSYERGSNENANRLIRKFIKKGEDIGKLPAAYIKRVEKWINNYPRRIFGYKTANMIQIA